MPYSVDKGHGTPSTNSHLDTSTASTADLLKQDNGISFGEPLQVSVSQGTERFKSIQRVFSKPQSLEEEEEASTGVSGSAEDSPFDLSAWLAGRNQGPPFAKRIGLMFDNLNVYGNNVNNRHISTVVTPFYKVFKLAAHGFGLGKLLNRNDDSRNRQLLYNMSGVVADGEMLLVLGRPGSGCSTLLRVLGNRRGTYRKITGNVSYGGLTPEEVGKRYRGEIAYNQEEDVHFPALTVRKTLQFAIQCKTPSSRVLNDRDNFQNEFLDTLLDMYGLNGCADTIVGNAFLRGVSGGERKRVSIAEQVASGASIDVWDGSTRGLDSSSALDYVRSLRITSDVLRKATVVSIYQASENIYELFDKVMVIEEGRQLYYGPANQAVAYFQSIGIEKPPRQTTSDFLTGVAQIHERRILPGWEEKAPRTAEDFERVWLESQQYASVRSEVESFTAQTSESSDYTREFREIVDKTKMGTENSRLRRRSSYITTFMYQLKLLFRREWELFWGDLITQLFKFGYNVAFAVIVGTLYLKLPDNTAGAFTRGSLLFFALLFHTLTVEAEMPKAFSGREVVYKHKAFAMYHPAALSLAQTVVDIPFVIVNIMAFSIILYFVTGLDRTAGQFFTFVLYLVVGSLCITAFYRLAGNVSPNISIAHTLSGVGVLFMILLIGYLQPPKSMHPWFKWIYWINPLAYSFKALMCNEFRNRRLECISANLVPGGAGFADISNQVCTLQGARPGQSYVLGRDYLADGYQFYIDDQWINFVAVFCFWIFFVAAIAFAMEFIEFGNTGYTINVFKRRRPNVDAYTDETIGSATDKEIATHKNVSSNGPTDAQILSGTTFTWNNVNYTVPIKGGERQLLNGVSGYIKPGTMTALMGSSGAGKTTLLDALSQRKTIGKLEGEMLMNGAPQPRSFRRITGYCEQLDVHNPHATVRESLRFSAALRQPDTVPESEKMEYVERVIYLLGLSDISDCLIGDPDSGEGISLEERKRLTIGVELVSKPKILFLDEPTSGLDAQASYKLMQFMRRLAENGQTILCTIHQPSAMLFEQFDRLLLLVRGGHTVYFGELGNDAATLISYFERNGAAPCAPTANPAEYILDVVGSKTNQIDWPQMWRDSPECQQTLTEISRINELQKSGSNSQISASVNEDDSDKVYARSYLFQTKLVMHRMFVMYWRNMSYNLTRLALQIMCALIVGFTFFRVNNGTADLQNRAFAIFECSFLSILIISQVQPQFILQRQYFGRETSTNQYDWRAFAAAIILTEWPFSIAANTVFFVCFYWTVGLNTITDRIGYFYVSYIVLGLFSLTLGQVIASFSPNNVIAAQFTPIFTAMMVLFSGLTISYQQMPKFWHSWMYWLSPFRYFVEGAITNELHGSQVKCRSKEFFVFNPPTGQTCSDYAGDWVSKAIGYLNNPNATESCQYCPYKVGDEFYASFSWSFSHRWRNIGIMFGFIAFNVVFTITMIRFFKINRR